MRRLATAPVLDGVRCLVFMAALDMIVPGLRSASAHAQSEFVTVGGDGHLGMLCVGRAVTALPTRG